MMKLNMLTSRRGFTLIEALISVAILLGIILFCSKIFSSVSLVTTSGQAAADQVQEIAAFEQQIRQDFEKIAVDGYIVIACRAVRNDINDPTRAGLAAGTDPRFWLDSTRDPLEYIRSDRILFFTQGDNTVQMYSPNQGANRKAMTSAARVYYGHGYQLGDAPAAGGANLDPNFPENLDFPPWDIGNNGSIIVEPNTTVDGFSQPAASQWTFARQNVLLGDDGGGTGTYLFQGVSTGSIWDFNIQASRADVAASQLNDIRNFVQQPGNGWQEMQFEMVRSMFYPNAERTARSFQRADFAATTSVLGSAVSDIMIDWTYGPETGIVADPLNPGGFYGGVRIPRAGEKPWFGMPDDDGGIITSSAFLEPRGVAMLGDEVTWDVDNAGPIFPVDIESLVADYYNSAPNDELDISYFATFGYNRNTPLNPETAQPWDVSGNPSGVTPYTPWPTAIRITLRVHDAGGRLPQGRVVQFIVNLPQR
ncbi:MAG: PulJ/GspJ family protein [Phycisphaerales bacterium]